MKHMGVGTGGAGSADAPPTFSSNRTKQACNW